MARKAKAVRHLLCRGGRWYARLAVPSDLREIVGKRELLEKLGPDRATAIVRLHAVVAGFHAVLAEARRGIAPTPLLISLRQAVHNHYASELRIDELIDLAGERGRPFSREFNENFSGEYVRMLRKVATGIVTDEERREGLVEAAIGWAMPKTAPPRNTKAYAELAVALASTQIEAIERTRERDKGDFKGQPTFKLLTEGPEKFADEKTAVSIGGLFDLYIAMLAKTGGGGEAVKRWRPCFRDLIAYLKHDDAGQITKADLNAWIEHLHLRLAPKTIKDVNFAAVKAVLRYAAEKDLIGSDPTVGIKVRLGTREITREKGFSRSEASAILKVSRGYQPKASDNPKTREGDALIAAKRWAPLLCALTGARIAEITQLRKEDVLEQDGIHYLNLTPEAGSIKSRQYRHVPLHRQIIAAGFLNFVAASSHGPLFFHENTRRAGTTHPSKFVSGRLSEWLQTLGLVPDGVKPNHGWRHTVKTLGTEAGIDSRVLDAIQGHAPRTAGDTYGNVSLRAKYNAVEKFPDYQYEEPYHLTAS